MNNEGTGSRLTRIPGLIFLGFAVVGAYFLFTEHRAHLFEYLPYVLLMACPLMHLFGHHHHHARADPRQPGQQDAPGAASDVQHVQ